MPWPSPSVQDLNKRLSLPADIRIPDGYLEKLQISSPPFDQPMSRRSRRASLVSFQPCAVPLGRRVCRSGVQLLFLLVALSFSLLSRSFLPPALPFLSSHPFLPLNFLKPRVCLCQAAAPCSFAPPAPKLFLCVNFKALTYFCYIIVYICHFSHLKVYWSRT